MTGAVGRGVRRCARGARTARGRCGRRLQPDRGAVVRRARHQTRPARRPRPRSTTAAPREPRPAPVHRRRGRHALRGSARRAAAPTRPPRWRRPPRRLAAADLAIVNLETSVGTGGRPEPGKRFTFSAGPAAFECAGRGRDRRGEHGQQPRPRLRPGPAPEHPRAARRAAGAARRSRSSGSAATPTRPSPRPSPTCAARAWRPSPPPSPTRTRRPTRPATGRPARTARRRRRRHRPARACSRRYDGRDAEADVVVAYLHWGVQGERCPSRRPALAGPPAWSRPAPTSSSARHAHRAAGRRPPRTGLRRLRAGQLRLVLPRPHRACSR